MIYNKTAFFYRKSIDCFSGTATSELDHWNNLAKSSNELYERKKAAAFARALQPIVKEIDHMESVRLGELEDSANSILGLIDDLWKLDGYKYPQDRMDRLLNICSNLEYLTYMMKKWDSFK